MTCPLCGGTEISAVQFGGKPLVQCVFGAAIRRCGACRFVFADVIHPQVLDYYYTYYCRHGLAEDVWGELRQKAEENGRGQLKTIQPFLPERIGRVLDFGGGSGEAARLYLPLADAVYVSESDPRSIAHIREEKRLKVTDPDALLTDAFVGFFDLVILSNVLEHMTYPRRRLEELSRIVAPGGLLFVEIPNEARLVTETGAHASQHVSFFTPETFRQLVETQGAFEFVDLRTCGAPLAAVLEAGEIIHDFDSLETPDGWVIRALLRNVRPTTELTPLELDADACMAAIRRASDILCRMANAAVHRIH